MNQTNQLPKLSILSNSRLIIARVGWVMFALLVVGLTIVALPAFIEQSRSICAPTIDCEFPRLSSKLAHELEGRGVSIELYSITLLASRLVISISCWFMGAVIFLRNSDERMALFTAYLLVGLGGVYGSNSGNIMSSLVTADSSLRWVVDSLGFATGIAFFLFLFTFPDGRIVPRWIWFTLPVIAIHGLIPLLAPDLDGSAIFFLLEIGPFALAVITQAYRYRTIYTPTQQSQTKWVVLGITASLLTLAIILMPIMLNSSENQPGTLNFWFSDLLLSLSLLFIPVSIGMAISRTNLWDIDILIRSSLIYGSLTTILALLYFALVVVIQDFTKAYSGQESSSAIVISTLAIAALFNPMRLRIQENIDRRFFRRKYDAQKTLEVFANKLRGEINLNQFGQVLLATVLETIQPEHSSLWLVSNVEDEEPNSKGLSLDAFQTKYWSRRFQLKD